MTLDDKYKRKFDEFLNKWNNDEENNEHDNLDEII